MIRGIDSPNVHQHTESGTRMLASIRELVTKHFSDGTTP